MNWRAVEARDFFRHGFTDEKRLWYPTIEAYEVRSKFLSDLSYTGSGKGICLKAPSDTERLMTPTVLVGA